MDTKGKKLNQKLQYTFEPHKWHFVCITHEYRFLGSSELKVYIDFKHKYEFPVAYPKIAEVIDLYMAECVAPDHLLSWYEWESEQQLSYGKISTTFWADELCSLLP